MQHPMKVARRRQSTKRGADHVREDQAWSERHGSAQQMSATRFAAPRFLCFRNRCSRATMTWLTDSNCVSANAQCEAEPARSCGAGSRRQRWFQPLDTDRCLSQKRFGQSAVDGNNVARGFGAVVAQEPHDSVGAVPRKNRAARQRALRIELGELVPQVLG